MIPTTEKELDLASNFAGEDVLMTVDKNAVEHLINILTDLYSDPEMAVIREISCNAFDAHREVGQQRPIEISLPTSLNPIFTVQDWGVGLNADGFRNIYSKYGSSTKRETNDQIGSLGLGCKSPLTYTNQFSVVGNKDGIKTTAMVMRNEHNIPMLKIVSEKPTDEANGVTVSIAANPPFSSLEQKAKKFFSFWDDNTVLVNGNAPEKQKKEIEFNNISLYKRTDRYAYGVTPSYVVMGNVAYPIDENQSNLGNILSDHGFIIRVPMGSVHFTPSREGLHYTQRTKETLKEAQTTIKEKLTAWIEEDITSQPTKPDVIRRVNYWKKALRTGSMITPRYGNLQYQGETIPHVLYATPQVVITPQPNTTIQSGTTPPPPPVPMSYTPAYDGWKKHQLISYAPLAAINDIWVEGFDRNYSVTVKKKLIKYLDDNNIEMPNDRFYFYKDNIDNKWIDPAKIIKWSDAEKTKLIYNRSSNPGKKQETIYEGFVNGTRQRHTTSDLKAATGLKLYRERATAPYGYKELSQFLALGKLRLNLSV